ncbi:MAG: methyltransferase domain-containing protein [Nocardioidaceae bacterium]
MTTTDNYLLGSDALELERLEHQARMLAPATRTILRLAGIRPGMRVLDLGTGAGDVALEAAEMVGPTGSVIGIDQSAEALSWAARRIEAHNVHNISFLHDDLHTVPITGRFDAVIGRLVLLYTPDPAAVLRRYKTLLGPDGVIVAMEYEMTAAGSIPPTPLSERIVSWITEAFRRSGLDPSLGARLGQVTADAGLDRAEVLGLQAYRAPNDPSGARMAAAMIRTLLPVLERTGVATPAEVDLETLEQRIAGSLSDNDAIFKPPTLVGAWSRA